MINNFKIEVIHFMVNTSNKFTVYNSNIEIQKIDTLKTSSTAFQHESIIVNIFWNCANIFQINWSYIIQISAIIGQFFAKLQCVQAESYQLHIALYILFPNIYSEILLCWLPDWNDHSIICRLCQARF